MPNNYYLDESGHTGPRLLDPDQPVLTVASLRLEPQEADELLASHFREEVAERREVKHTTLRGSGRGQRKAVALISSLAENPDRVRIEVVHKRYALAGKLIDLVVEPVVHADGLDLHAGRENVGIASVISTVLPVLMGPGPIDSLLSSFQDYVLNGGRRNYFDFLKALSAPEWKRAPLVRTVIKTAIRRQGGAKRLRLLSKADLDLEFSSAYKLMGLWAASHPGQAKLYFDRTAHMSRHPEFWTGLTNTKSGLGSFQYGEHTMALAKQVTTHFEPSGDHAGLQLTDVVAGAARIYFQALWGGTLEEDMYASALAPALQTLIDAGAITGTAPDLEFYEDADQYELTPMLDELTEYVRNEDLRPFDNRDRQ